MSKRLCILYWCTIVFAAAAANPSVKDLKLKVSANGRYFETQDGKPFFYLGDTVWTLFKRVTHEEDEDYLQNRKTKGFTVVQAYLLRGLKAKNLDGELTLVDDDPTKLNERFFENVDWI